MFIRKRRYRRQLKRPKWQTNMVDGRYVQSWREETDRTYYQVCESYRDAEGRPRQRVICTLKPKPLSMQLADKRSLLAEYGDRHPRLAESLRTDIAMLERLREQIGDWQP